MTKIVAIDVVVYFEDQHVSKRGDVVQVEGVRVVITADKSEIDFYNNGSAGMAPDAAFIIRRAASDELHRSDRGMYVYPAARVRAI